MAFVFVQPLDNRVQPPFSRVIDGCLVCVGGFCFPVSDQTLLPEKLFIIAGEAEDRRLLGHLRPIRGRYRGWRTNERAGLCLLGWYNVQWSCSQLSLPCPPAWGDWHGSIHGQCQPVDTILASDWSTLPSPGLWLVTSLSQCPLEDTEDTRGPGQWPRPGWGRPEPSLRHLSPLTKQWPGLEAGGEAGQWSAHHMLQWLWYHHCSVL